MSHRRTPDLVPPAADVLIGVEGVSKRYCRDLRRSLRYAMTDTVRDLAGRPAAAALRPGEFWALRDVSFEIRRGESVAVMGVNGAGKSTLLGLILGTLRLNGGRAVTRGRLAILSDHGLGCDPALTGRENAYLSAAVLEADRRRVEAALPDIVAFAELEAFIDAPVRTYSDGMRARLGFAVAMHLAPDILLVDEVLAVGDLGFQRRCIERAKTFVEEGGSLVLVSHNPHVVQSLCDRCLVLDGGRLLFDGDVVAGVARYFDAVRASPDDPLARAPERPRRLPPVPAAVEPGVVVLEAFGVDGSGGGPVRTGAPARVYVRYRAACDVSVRWGFCLLTADLQTTIACDGRLDACVVPAGRGELSGTIARWPLCGGRYAIRVTIMDPATELPFALGGFGDAPCCFDVEMADTRRNNYRQLMKDLIVLEDFEWQIRTDRDEPAGRRA